MSDVVERELLEQFLQRWPVGRLATIRSDSADSAELDASAANERVQPHAVPIVFAMANGSLYSPIDGKPKSTANLLRLRNIQARPQFSLLLDHYAADWNELWWVRLDGAARAVQPVGVDRARIVDAFKQKYPQYDHTSVLRREGMVLELRWSKAVGWSAAGDVNAQLERIKTAKQLP